MQNTLSLLYSLPDLFCLQLQDTITQAAQLCCLWLWSEGFRVLCHWSLLLELFPIVLLTKALKVKWIECSSQLLKKHFSLLSVNHMIPSIALDPNNIPQSGELTAVLQLQGLNTVYSQHLPSFRQPFQTIGSYWNVQCIALGRCLRKGRPSFLVGFHSWCCGQKAEMHVTACGIRLKKSQ